MSELMDIRHDAGNWRWQLLAGVSTLALLVTIYDSGAVEASDGDVDRPTVWIDLGGQLEHLSGQGDDFAPAFLAANAGADPFKPVSPARAEQPPDYSYGGQGEVSFEPRGSNWIFSASLRYGRSNNDKHVHQQTFLKVPTAYPIHANIPTADEANYADTTAKHEESHAIMDFMAGKDVGLGMFGLNGSSIVSLGVRFAQFASSANVKIRARPDIQIYPAFGGVIPAKYFRNYAFQGEDTRSFHGIGPSLSWNGSAPLLGNVEASELSLDWGANAAILFGRQKVYEQHATTGRKRYHVKTNCCSHTALYTSHYVTRYKHGASDSRARSVTVSNLGVFAGLSLRHNAAKVSLGYRADFFLGAIDGGIDTARSDTIGFHGPFAAISIGLP